MSQFINTASGYSALDMLLMCRAKHVGLFAQPPARGETAALDAFGRL